MRSCRFFRASSKLLICIFFLVTLFLCTTSLYAQSQSYLSIEDVKQKLELDIYWEPLTEELLLSKDELTASLSLDSQMITYSNHLPSFFPNALKKENGILMISQISFNDLARFFNRTNERKNEPTRDLKPTENTLYAKNGKHLNIQIDDIVGYRVGAILIDPGHGGRDAGCVGSYVENGKTHIVYEKNIALTVSLDLYNRLKKTYPDKKIILTRNGDYYPTLPERVKQANSIKVKENESILYISIHANASLNNRAQGFEVWYLPPEYRRNVLEKTDETKEIHTILNSMLEEEYTMESILMSKYVLDGLDQQIGNVSRNRGIKEEEYIVVKGVNMPSILVELGFVSNKEEAKRLCTPSYLDKCTTGIYNGLTSFIYQFESSKGFIAR